jgi:signal transduction histidine kinase
MAHKLGAGHSIHWDILKLADQNIISQTHSLNILRIIQEAIYNAMHRAHSKKIIIAVDCLEDGNTVVFVVKKNKWPTLF